VVVANKGQGEVLVVTITALGSGTAACLTCEMLLDDTRGEQVRGDGGDPVGGTHERGIPPYRTRSSPVPMRARVPSVRRPSAR
jgi:hypothetical protein